MGRPKKLAELQSVEDCTRAMGDLLSAATDIEVLTAERDLAVASASATFETRLDDARTRKADAETALERYYYAHITEIEAAGVKHCQLANGVIGRRMHPPKLMPLNRKWTWKAICAAVRGAWGLKYFHPAKEPEIDKDLVKASLTDEQLRGVGLKVDSEETFYAEPARLPALEVKA